MECRAGRRQRAWPAPMTALPSSPGPTRRSARTTVAGSQRSGTSGPARVRGRRGASPCRPIAGEPLREGARDEVGRMDAAAARDACRDAPFGKPSEITTEASLYERRRGGPPQVIQLARLELLGSRPVTGTGLSAYPRRLRCLAMDAAHFVRLGDGAGLPGSSAAGTERASAATFVARAMTAFCRSRSACDSRSPLAIHERMNPTSPRSAVTRSRGSGTASAWVTASPSAVLGAHWSRPGAPSVAAR